LTDQLDLLSRDVQNPGAASIGSSQDRAEREDDSRSTIDCRGLTRTGRFDAIFEDNLKQSDYREEREDTGGALEDR
jgi:hypothetical protein